MKTVHTKAAQPGWSPNPAKEGMALLIVMLVLSAMILLAVTSFTVIQVNTSSTGAFKLGTDAFYHADSGVKYALSHIRKDYDYGALTLDNANEPVLYTAPTGLLFDPITNLVRLADGETYAFEVTGRALSSKAVIEVAINRPNSFSWDIFGGDQITISGGSGITGNMRSNGDITLSGGAPVYGDAIPGPGGSVSEPSQVTGDTTPASSPVVLDPVDAAALAAAQASNNNSSIDPAYLSGDALSVGGDTLVLNPGVYYFTDATFSGGATLEVTGSVEIWMSDKLTFSGGSIDNPSTNPDLLHIYSTTTDKITISGSSQSYAHIYAPNSSEIVVSGGGTYHGSLVTPGKVTFSGGSSYGGGGLGSGSDIQILSWKQK